MTYAGDVISGKIPASDAVVSACQRHFADLDAGVWHYDPARADRAVRFIQLLPHVKGEWAGRKILLEPWEIFIVGSIFGWVHPETGLRRYRYAYVSVPRKNGKSILAAAIGLYMLAMDDEPGAEVYSGASTERQAHEVFRPARQIALRCKDFRLAAEMVVKTKSLECGDGSMFRPLVGNPGDGASPHCAIIDEYHEHDSDVLYDAMITGMGARRQPLALVITTAGTDISGPCYAMQRDALRVLGGTMKQENWFIMIFGLDERDDWTTPAALRKANPNYGISVSEDFLLGAQAAAIASARKASTFRTKHLNIWTSGRNAWMNLEWWNRQADAYPLEHWLGAECWMAIDLSSKLDISCTALIFHELRQKHNNNDDDQWHYHLYVRSYLPASVLSAPENDHYRGWAESGDLIVTDGDIIDYQRIEADIAADGKQYRVIEVGYDPWGATQLAQRLKDEHGLMLIEIAQTVRNFSDPMKSLEALTKAGLLHHSGDGCLDWMMGNVVVREDAKSNIYPRKESDEKKIDGASASIMALGRALAEDSKQIDISAMIV